MKKQLSALAKRYQKLSGLTTIEENKKIIDCACGTGVGSAFILETFKPEKLLCIDNDRQVLEQCKERTLKKANYLCIDLQEFIDDEKFDYFFCLETLEHISENDNLKASHIISSSIKNKGKLLISVPGNEWEEKRVKNPLHLQFVSKKTLINMFSDFILEEEDKFIKRKSEPQSYNLLYVFVKKL